MSNLSNYHRSSPDEIRALARKIAGGGSHNIPGKEIAPLGEVSSAAQFIAIAEAEAVGIGQGESIPYGSVWCGVCNTPCDFDEGGLFKLSGRRDATGNYGGYRLIRAQCHGDKADIVITDEDARRNAGRVILAFPYPKQARRALAVTQDAARPVLLLMDKGHSYWTRQRFPERPSIWWEYAKTIEDSGCA